MPSTPFLLVALALVRPSVDDFDDRMEALIKQQKIPGVAVAYSENGQLKFSKGYGFADLEQNTKMTPEHVHELASVSKQFTAACILKLREKGKLSLADPISKYFDKAPSSWKKVTIRHLLQHTSGLPDYLAAVRSPADEMTPAQMIDAIREKPLLFEPGTKWQYSNSGYMVLGQIVAKVSEQTLGAFLYKEIFAPAGMKSAVWNDPRAVVPNRAEGYTVRKGLITREDFTSTALSQTGDGEVMASALDLIAWDAALRTGKVLNAESQRLMNEVSEPSKKSGAGITTGYGLGVNVARFDGKVRQSHAGGWMGTSTFLARFVDEGKCLVVLCNSDQPTTAIQRACVERFLGGE